MDFQPVVALALAVLCLIEVREHNKKVDQTWPDISDPQQFQQHERFHIQPVAHYLLLIYTVFLFIAHIIGILK